MISAAIVGASGYSGAELLRLLSLHNDVRIHAVAAHQWIGKRVDELYPVFSGNVDLTFGDINDESFMDADVVFLALPSGTAMSIVPGLLKGRARVVDLGGDFRLKSPQLYEQYYGHSHTAIPVLADAVYGLPELNGPAIRDARLVANPGCYPTSALLPLLPVIKGGIIAPGGITINSLSGVSGAGRSSSADMSFAEINENIRAYKIGRHQHIPEIQAVLESVIGEPVQVSFVPHLVPITRGIYTTIHANLSGSYTDAEIFDCYKSFYRDAAFVRIRTQIPQLKDVLYTNYCDIFCSIERRTNQLIMVSVIDNLVKGAAGQAIQNMNIMSGYPEASGLKGKENHQQ